MAVMCHFGSCGPPLAPVTLPHMPNHHCQLVLTTETPAELWRADRAVQSLTQASRRRTQGLFDHACVQLNGQLCRQPWQPLQPGDRIEVEYDPEQPYATVKKTPKYLGFQVLFEDEHLVVVEKPASWLTVPSDRQESNTLVQRVAAYLTKRNRGRAVRVWAIHRLDRGVSGVLAIARNPATADVLRQQFAEHRPERRYVAIVAGRMTTDRGTFESRLGSGPDRRQQSVSEEESGQDAVTHYTVDRFWPLATLVRIQLETGRRNQIRVHFAEAGHPILGDYRYGEELWPRELWRHDRLALHAELLALEHPVTGKQLRFELPLPAEFQQFIQADGYRNS